MRQHPSAWRLQDDGDDDDDNDDDDENEEEQVDDNVWSILVLFHMHSFFFEWTSNDCVSVLRGDGKTRTIEGDFGRLGQVPHEAAAISDRVPSRLGLRLLPSARYLNPGFSSSCPSSSSSCFSLSREMTHIEYI